MSKPKQVKSSTKQCMKSTDLANTHYKAIRSVRFAKYRENRRGGMNQYQSAIKAGYSRWTALVAYRKLESRIPFSDYLLLAGASNEALANYVKQGLEATRPISTVIKNAETKEKTHGFTDVPDWANRHKYLETALKLKGYLNNDTNSGGNSIAVNLSIAQTGVKGEIIDVTTDNLLQP